MKPHRILKSFKGTQDGLHDHEEFVAGTVAHLSKGLAAIVTKEGWAEPHEIQPRTLAEGKMLEAGELPEDSTTQEKSEGAAPENKMKKAAPENKKAKK